MLYIAKEFHYCCCVFDGVLIRGVVDGCLEYCADKNCERTDYMHKMVGEP